MFAGIAVLLGPAGSSADNALDVAPVLADERRWEVHGSTGFVYDSNVTLDPSGQPVPGTVADPADGAFVLGAGGSVDLVDTDRAEVGLEYELYQSLYFRLHDYNLRSNRVQGTAGFSLVPALWAGLQAGYQHYALGGSAYSGEAFVTPFLSLIEGAWGLGQLLYRHGDMSYLSPPFEGIRDGPNDAASVVQTIYWRACTVSLGYEFGSERPSAAAGDDYRYRSQQLFAGLVFTPGWQTTVDLMYLFRYENYTEPNSFAAYRTRRQDHISQFHAGVERPVAPHLAVALSYFGTVDDSNIPVFEYRRHVVQAELRFSY